MIGACTREGVSPVSVLDPDPGDVSSRESGCLRVQP
jgi:hypothetical protein